MVIFWDRLRPERETMVQRNTAWFLIVIGLLLSAFFLGLPQFHYAVALMIAVILRYRDAPLNEPLFRSPPPGIATEQSH